MERFNGRIEEVLQTHHFDSTADLDTTLHRYVELYNHHIPQKVLGHLTPIQALKNWQLSHPHLFRKRVYNHAGLDIYRLYNDLENRDKNVLFSLVGAVFSRQVHWFYC